MMLPEFDAMPDILDGSQAGKQAFTQPFVVRGGFKDDPLFGIMSLRGIAERFGDDDICLQGSITEDGTNVVKMMDYLWRLNGGEKLASWSWQPHMAHGDLMALPNVVDKFDCFFRQSE